MRKALAAIVVVAAFVAASAPAAHVDLARYALTVNDVPSGLRHIYGRHTSVAQAAHAMTENWFGFQNSGGYQLLLMDLKLSQYREGYVAAFSNAPIHVSPWDGHPIVFSGVEAYADARDARMVEKLDSISAQLEGIPCHKLTGPFAVGEESMLCSKTGTLGGHKVVIFIVRWRQGSLRGLVEATGPVGALQRSQVLAMARIQESRMKTA